MVQTSPLSATKFEWSVILAGTFVACAISIVLIQFGAAIGLSSDTPYGNAEDWTHWSVIATGIWILWAQLLASLAGGYLAGYARTPTPEYTPHENELKNGLYGLSVWAVSTVFVFIAVALAGAGATYVALETGTYNDSTFVTDAEQNTGIIFAFVTGSVSLLSAAAAWWAATMAGEHRASAVDFGTGFSFRK
jgi:hypothetical protein